MPVQFIPKKTDKLFVALRSQPTVQGPVLGARTVATVAPGMFYECLAVAQTEEGYTWAALKTNVQGLSAEWVRMYDETKPGAALGVVIDLVA